MAVAIARALDMAKTVQVGWGRASDRVKEGQRWVQRVLKILRVVYTSKKEPRKDICSQDGTLDLQWNVTPEDYIISPIYNFA